MTTHCLGIHGEDRDCDRDRDRDQHREDQAHQEDLRRYLHPLCEPARKRGKHHDQQDHWLRDTGFSDDDSSGSSHPRSDTNTHTAISVWSKTETGKTGSSSTSCLVKSNSSSIQSFVRPALAEAEEAEVEVGAFVISCKGDSHDSDPDLPDEMNCADGAGVISACAFATTLTAGPVRPISLDTDGSDDSDGPGSDVADGTDSEYGDSGYGGYGGASTCDMAANHGDDDDDDNDLPPPRFPRVPVPPHVEASPRAAATAFMVVFLDHHNNVMQVIHDTFVLPPAGPAGE